MPSETDNKPMISQEQMDVYHRDGYVVLPNFLSEAEVAGLRAACHRLVEDMNPADHQATTFTSEDKIQARNDYFITSGDQVRFFYENDALDNQGNLKVPKQRSLNKIGHALHWKVPQFREVSFSAQVKTVARQLGFVSPAVVQSMYIFKQPGYGGEVCPHKDSTFLATAPQSCVGLWFALEDATEDNGCLWFSPGSHNTPTDRRFVRTTDTDGVLTTKFSAPPDEDDPSRYVPVPVNKGSLAILHGSVDHKSAKNTSSRSRHIYTFHLVECHNTTWDEGNWLQPTPSMPFTRLYDN